MIKNILKEIIIILILCVVITALLAVVFYDKNPIAKVVPSKIAYTTPENIAEELKSSTDSTEVELAPQNKVYTIDGSDLNLYKKSKAYDPSKDDPFANSVLESSSTGTTASKVGDAGSSSGSSDQSSSEEIQSGSSSSASSSSSSSSSTSTATSSEGSASQATGKKAKLK